MLNKMLLSFSESGAKLSDLHHDLNYEIFLFISEIETCKVQMFGV